MRKLDADRSLRSFTYNETDTLEQFFKDLRDLRKKSVDAGNTVSDEEFRAIILSAFPGEAFDTIIQNITSSSSFPSSTSVIQQISSSYRRVADRKGAASTGNNLSAQAHAAVLARIEELENQVKANATEVKKCHNCGRLGHIKPDCFRKGGGKEGQYPSWWKGKKDSSITPKANSAVADPNLVHYAMSTSYPSNLAVADPNLVHYALNTSSPSNPYLVYADSAASDHFFTRRADFLTYTPMDREGQSSEKDTKFRIVGTGKAR
ncbi:hypothetical protein K435DRAFT_702545, partial [Dendrothele bispora CBS 962.96]